MLSEENRNSDKKRNKPSARSTIIKKKHDEARETLIDIQLELEFIKSFCPSDKNIVFTKEEINSRRESLEEHCEYWLARLKHFKGLKQARLDNLALGAFKHAPDKIIIKGGSCFCEENSAKIAQP